MAEKDNNKESREAEQAYPKVEFTVDKQQDIAKLKNFLKRDKNRGGADMRQIVLSSHPELKEGEVGSYVNRYCGQHNEELEVASSRISNAWIDYSPEFFEATSVVFSGMEWPKGEYKGYVSISPPFPRFLHVKNFHLPYDSTEKAVRVTAHEMMHFMFYEYVRQRYVSDLPNTLEKEMEGQLEGVFQVPLWEMSEIFNLIVLSDEKFGAGKARGEASSYSDLVQYLEKFEKLWNESDGDVDEFFSRMEAK